MKPKLLFKIPVHRVSDTRFAELVGITRDQLRYWKKQVDLPETDTDNPLHVLRWRDWMSRNTLHYVEPEYLEYVTEDAE